MRVIVCACYIYSSITSVRQAYKNPSFNRFKNEILKRENELSKIQKQRRNYGSNRKISPHIEDFKSGGGLCLPSREEEDQNKTTLPDI